MYFLREYGAGLEANRRNPLDKIWAEFKCSLCDSISEIDISMTRATFDFDRERRCPKCGQIDANDKAQNLKATLDRLTVEKSRIEVQIDQCERELNEVSIRTSASTERK